jgi:hypothetical protein
MNIFENPVEINFQKTNKVSKFSYKDGHSMKEQKRTCW